MSQLALPFPLRERFCLDEFWSAGNEELISALRALPSAAEFQTLWLWGESASGRSHLLQACCGQALEAGSTAIYLPARQAKAADLLPLNPLPSLVCIDDIDRWLGNDDGDEARLMRLCEQLRAAAGTLLVSALRPPDRQPFRLADLSSRLRSGIVYPLGVAPEAHWPDLLRSRAKALNVKLDDAVVSYWLSRGPRSLAALMAQLDALAAASLADQQRITVPYLKQVLALHG